MEEGIPRRAVLVVLSRAGDEVRLRAVDDMDLPARVREPKKKGRNSRDGIVLVRDEGDANIRVQKVGPGSIPAAREAESRHNDVYRGVNGVFDHCSGHCSKCRTETVACHDNLVDAGARQLRLHTCE